jgi:hypothetical protein
MGIGKHGNQVNVIDFSLEKKFKDPQMHLHILYRENENLTGAALYTYINIHLGVEQACHDNLKSLAYLLMYFLCSALSWQGLKAATKKQKYNHIMEKKVTTPPISSAMVSPMNLASSSTTLVHSASTTNLIILTLANSSAAFSSVKATSMTTPLIGVFREHRMMVVLVPVARRQPQAEGRSSRKTKTTMVLVTGCKHDVSFSRYLIITD